MMIADSARASAVGATLVSLLVGARFCLFLLLLFGVGLGDGVADCENAGMAIAASKDTVTNICLKRTCNISVLLKHSVERKSGF